MVLAEAGEDFHNGAVVNTAQKLLKKKPAAGWKYERLRRKGIRGLKFHVFEEPTVVGSPLIVWSFVAVTESSLEKDQAKSFIEKLIYITEVMRSYDDEWRNGDTLAAQVSFAPILLDKMEQVTSQGRLAMVNENITTTKELKAENVKLARTISL